MNTLRMRVRNGRLEVLDEPTDLPEGAEFQAVLVPPDEALDDEEHEELGRRIRDVKNGGELVDGEALIARLRQRP